MTLIPTRFSAKDVDRMPRIFDILRLWRDGSFFPLVINTIPDPLFS